MSLSGGTLRGRPPHHRWPGPCKCSQCTPDLAQRPQGVSRISGRVGGGGASCNGGDVYYCVGKAYSSSPSRRQTPCTCPLAVSVLSFPPPPSHPTSPARRAARPCRAPPQMMMFITLFAGDQSRLRWSGPTRTARRARRSRGRRGSASPSCHSPRAPTAHAAHTTRAGTRCPSPCRGAEPPAACALLPPPRPGPRRGGARRHGPGPCSRSRWRGKAEEKRKRAGGGKSVSAEREGMRAHTCTDRSRTQDRCALCTQAHTQKCIMLSHATRPMASSPSAGPPCTHTCTTCTDTSAPTTWPTVC